MNTMAIDGAVGKPCTQFWCKALSPAPIRRHSYFSIVLADSETAQYGSRRL